MGCVWSKSHRICDLEEEDKVDIQRENGSCGLDHTLGKRSKKKKNTNKFKSFKRNFRHQGAKTKKSNSISSDSIRTNDNNGNLKPVIQFDPKPESGNPLEPSQQEHKVCYGGCKKSVFQLIGLWLQMR